MSFVAHGLHSAKRDEGLATCPPKPCAKEEEGSHSPDQKFYFVYLLRSIADPDRVYVGITEYLDQRLAEHNAGKAKHTAKYRPWEIETYVAFSDKEKAVTYERYLKTSSGIAFARKRLRSF